MADDKPSDSGAGADTAGASSRPGLRPTGPGMGLRSSLRPSSGSAGGSLSRLGRADNSSGPLLPQPREQKSSDGGLRREAEQPEEDDDGKDEEPEEMHPLFQAWTFWFDKRTSSKSGSRMQAQYESNLKPVGEFEDVETFWQFYNNMQPASKIELGANYHLFRAGVKPMWEDPQNKKGGKWTVHLKGNYRNNLDSYWKNVVLAIIGELLDDHDDVMGAVMSRRGKADRIAVWNRTQNDKEKIMSLGKKIKELLQTNIPGPHDLPMEYNSHEDSMKSGTSYSNPSKYEL